MSGYQYLDPERDGWQVVTDPDTHQKVVVPFDNSTPAVEPPWAVMAAFEDPFDDPSRGRAKRASMG